MRHEPQRTCIGCQQTKPKGSLLRVVRRPSGEVAIDPTLKEPGRGAYLCAQSSCLDDARRSGSLARALRRSVDDSAIDGLAERIEDG